MKIVQINMVDFGSTGKIMLQIAKVANKQGVHTITYSTRQQTKRYKPMPTAPEGHKYYGSFVGNNLHYLLSRITGKYGCYSYYSTYKLLREIKTFKPDLIHLHNLHAAFLNLPMLFHYIKKQNLPIVWTLHDCWSFTGKCPYFDMVKCVRWEKGCYDCPQLKEYPQSLTDCSTSMWHKKKKWYEGIQNLTLITPSQWLADLAKRSMLKDADIRVINNGIDLAVFRPTESNFRQKYACESKFVILGVAFGWGERKGLDVFLKLAEHLNEGYQIVLLGTDAKVDENLPKNIISIHRTQNQQELAEIYTAADLFVNPTREENYPTVNMEALACGTPVLTFRTGGSPEIIDETCGCAVECDDFPGLLEQIEKIHELMPYTKEACLQRAKAFDANQKFDEYCNLYKEICNKKVERSYEKGATFTRDNT
ncbi:MAG: glycosyltransferase [Oscillospiraceae bacterium]|nr:glycosyltransferase [Oscillospiraceae bacterium]